ncbi:MAG: hypothetical protein V9G23_18525 [Giesbergeria sp.]
MSVSMRYAQGRAAFAVFIITMLFGALVFCNRLTVCTWCKTNSKSTAGELITFVTYTAVIGGSNRRSGQFLHRISGRCGRNGARAGNPEIANRSPKSGHEANHPAGRLTR